MNNNSSLGYEEELTLMQDPISSFFGLRWRFQPVEMINASKNGIVS